MCTQLKWVVVDYIHSGQGTKEVYLSEALNVSQGVKQRHLKVKTDRPK